MTTDDLTSRGWSVAVFSCSNGCSRAQTHWLHSLLFTAAATAKSLQSCLTLCDPIDGSPPGSSVPGILQVRTLEWVAISFSNAWKWKVKVNSLSRVQPFETPWTEAYQAPPSMGFARQEYWSGLPWPSPENVSNLVSSISGLLFCYICWKKWTCRSRKCNTDSSSSKLEITLILTIYNVLK